MNRMTKNFMYNLIYHVFSLLTPLIVTPYITRILSADLIGENALVNAEVSYFCIVGTLGITTLGVRKIASRNGVDQEQDLNNEFWGLYYVQLTMYLLVVAVYLLYINLLRDENGLLYRLYLLHIISMMFDISWFFQGVENFKYIAVRNVMVRIVSTVLIFLLVRQSNQIDRYIFCLYLPQLVLNIGMFISGKRKYGLHLIRYNFESKIFRTSLLLAIPAIATSVYTMLDRLILGYFRTSEEVAIYDQGQVLIKVILSVISAWGTAVLPRISNVYINEPNKVDELIKKSTNSVGFFVGGLFWGLVALNEPFIQIYLPSGFQYVSTVLYICSPMIIVVSIENIFGAQVLLSMGKDKEYTISVVFAAIINGMLDYVFIPKYGLSAACISSVLAEGVAMMIQGFFCRKLINIKITLIIYIKYILAGTIILLVSHAILFTFGKDIVQIVLSMICSAVIYFVITRMLSKLKK